MSQFNKRKVNRDKKEIDLLKEYDKKKSENRRDVFIIALLLGVLWLLA